MGSQGPCRSSGHFEGLCDLLLFAMVVRMFPICLGFIIFCFIDYLKVTDLQLSIQFYRKLLVQSSSTYLLRAHCLANVPYIRYRRANSSQDLDNAIILFRKAIHLSPPGDPQHLLHADRLAPSLWARFVLLWKKEDMEPDILINRSSSTASRILRER
jgi:hypothetical protein